MPTSPRPVNHTALRHLVDHSCRLLLQSQAPHLQGNIGPSLNGVGSRQTTGQIRQRLIDARKLNPDTVMPPYHVVDGLNRVGHSWQDRPALSAQQIEDVVAFLATLRMP